MNKTLLVIIFSLFVSACSSRSGFSIPEVAQPSPKIQFENLFLRGVFNWWEATSAYQFKKDSNGWYVNVELIADGQPYDFRLSDAIWTPSQSCGGNYKGQSVMVSTKIFLVCKQGSENLQFTPSNTGIYRFQVAPADDNEVSLVITRMP
ncbi:hypothetical protein R1T43_00565 [Alteromonas sp. CI.11.F.A3]|uniref:hypothetical protein n=1 Tax=Alteromonas sp. CI.11.F.A3 TaxID=3079555 RepID=UPI002943BF87|nr:hypothetical protein [Alteromonas sp. CI.11.F.A3]WOI37560.1 hypothetical protein R1T43_00565 [Alteromonas sp. CI.11.F.A3]